MLSVMDTSMTIQGREISRSDILFIKDFILEHPSWHRTRLSQNLCELWDWRNANGDLKDMSCRNMLLKLDRQGHICLPPAIRKPPQLGSVRIAEMLHSTDPIATDLINLSPITIVDARENPYHHDLFNYFVHRYHYLSFRSTVGENMKYMAFDRRQRPLACLLYGAPAWKTQSRDRFIGWSPGVRQKNLNCLTNNTRFLIFPWLKVKNLASHLLGRVAKRINNDWLQRYHHPIFMLETFVDRSRFAGTCYKAANWIHVGHTTGRTRQDRHHTINTSIKDVYVYPLSKHYKQLLSPNPSDNTQVNENPANATSYS